LLAFLQDFVNFKSFLRKKGRKKGADINEGKFVLNIDFIIALKPDGFCVYETMDCKQLNKTAYNFSLSLILIPFFIILNFLNKKESNKLFACENLKSFYCKLKVY
jgi:hypothetical protein